MERKADLRFLFQYYGPPNVEKLLSFFFFFFFSIHQKLWIRKIQRENYYKPGTEDWPMCIRMSQLFLSSRQLVRTCNDTIKIKKRRWAADSWFLSFLSFLNFLFLFFGLVLFTLLKAYNILEWKKGWMKLNLAEND